MSHQVKECFSFQYVIDLGNQKISNLFINQDSDPYIEASKFCAKLSLPSIIVTILGDAIKEQIQQEKDIIYNQRAKKSLNMQNNQHNNGSIPSLFDTMNTQMKEQTTQFSQIYPQGESNGAKVNRNERSSVFDNLYNHHKIIQEKKQLSRKKSFQSIPFRPQINQLSQKIVKCIRKKSQSQPTEQKKALKEHTPVKNDEIKVHRLIQYKKISANSQCKSQKSLNKQQRIYRNHQNQNDPFKRTELHKQKSESKTKLMSDTIGAKLQAKLMQGCSYKHKFSSNKKIRMI